MTTAHSFPLTPIEVTPPWLTALKAYSNGKKKIREQIKHATAEGVVRGGQHSIATGLMDIIIIFNELFSACAFDHILRRMPYRVGWR